MSTTTTTTTTSSNGNSKAPRWLTALRGLYTAGAATSFILHLNVNDYVGTSQGRVPGYLFQVFASFPIVVVYDRAHGMQFATASMEAKFKQLTQASAPATTDPILAALGQTQNTDLPTAPGPVLALLETAMRTEKCCVIITDAETIVPAGDAGALTPDDRTNLVRVRSWGTDGKIAAHGSVALLLTTNLSSLAESLRAASSKWEAIAVDLPTFEDRLAAITAMAAQISVPIDAETARLLANATAGLSLIHIEDILLRAAQAGAVTLELVRERKQSIIATEFGEVLEIMEPAYGWEGIGGLEHVKRWFTANLVRPLREGRREMVPMGVLMTGPAGTGKSAAAQAIAKESGVNAVKLNLAKILGQYVGNSERNLDRALQAIESLAPCIVFIDEIDQALQRGQGGDSGVSSRLFGRLLQYMAETEHRGRVVFLAATNRPDYMDAAQRRAGRFDAKVPFLLPDTVERIGIAHVMARRYGLGDLSNGAKLMIAKSTEGWTGAELELAAVKARQIQYADATLDGSEALIVAVSKLMPSTADVEYMTMLALRETNDQDLVPERYMDAWLALRKAGNQAAPSVTVTERTSRTLDL